MNNERKKRPNGKEGKKESLIQDEMVKIMM